MHRFTLALLLLVFQIACGGSGSSPGNDSANSGSGSPPGQFVPVSVASGQTLMGLDITVPAPASSPTPNAEDLGVGGGTAFGTGAQIRLGQTAPVLLFGPGLSASMTVRFSGPADITVSNIVGIRATDGTPGIQFTAAVAPGAAIGGRTVFLSNPQNDITAFSGGLEVIP